ncbi:hypothetical protein [Prosthecobacter sp.]|jgi:hypothetical protein|uniref:hypothetical protein n=1 Tax=Prosthecobacter sp. TaxID=1965333 RepID=UPI0037840408
MRINASRREVLGFFNRSFDADVTLIPNQISALNERHISGSKSWFVSSHELSIHDGAEFGLICHTIFVIDSSFAILVSSFARSATSNAFPS